MLLAGVSGCSLLVQFDPETQPCDSAGACGVGYFCSDAGLCHSTDGGLGAPDSGGTDGSTCTSRETSCADGVDNDCDNLKDCADSDCNGLGCDDRAACTTGETCGAGVCQRGTPMACNTPPNACQGAAGSCLPDAGRCVYPTRADGSFCGTVATSQSSRYCSGTCIDISVNSANCGGCGLACATSQTCQPLERSACLTPEPGTTSGRCTCGMAGVACPGGQTCSTASTCRPSANTQCAPGGSLGDGGVCGAYCRY